MYNSRHNYSKGPISGKLFSIFTAKPQDIYVFFILPLVSWSFSFSWVSSLGGKDQRFEFVGKGVKHFQQTVIKNLCSCSKNITCATEVALLSPSVVYKGENSETVVRQFRTINQSALTRVDTSSGCSRLCKRRVALILVTYYVMSWTLLHRESVKFNNLITYNNTLNHWLSFRNDCLASVNWSKDLKNTSASVVNIYKSLTEALYDYIEKTKEIIRGVLLNVISKKGD